MCGKNRQWKEPNCKIYLKNARGMGKKVVIIRHPMPYGVLKNEIVERFSTIKDLEKYKTTIEEREDYEPHHKKQIRPIRGC